MLKGKWLALLLVLLLGIGTVTGCSPTEQSYYNLLKEASSQKVYTDTGSIELSVAQLPASLFTGQDALNEDVIRKAIDQQRLEYSGMVDVNQNIFQYKFYMLDIKTGARSQVLSITYKNNVLYVKVDEIVKYIEQFCEPEEKQRLEQAFLNVEWLSISDQELNAMMPIGSQTGLTNNLLKRSSQQQMIWTRLYDGLFNEVYNNFSSNLVSKDNDKYTLKIRGAQLIDVMKPTATYTINNIDKLGTVLKAFLSSLSPAELAELALTNEVRGQALQGIDLMVLEVNQDPNKYLGEIEKMSAAQPQLLNIVNDSELVSTFEKTNATTYDRSSRIHLNITAGNPNDKINLTLNTKDTIKVGGTVQVSAPTGQVISFTELDKRMPLQIKVNIDNGAYTQINGISSSSGNMTVQVVDDRTYLPLNQAAVAMGEIVDWDSAANQAYVIHNGQRIDMNGIVINDISFVKAIDFEKLGFKVDWNENTRTVTIEK